MLVANTPKCRELGGKARALRSTEQLPEQAKKQLKEGNFFILALATNNYII